MSQDRSSDDHSWSVAGWITKTLLTVGILYLFTFALLVFCPTIAKALARAGISESVLEKIFYPIFKLIGAT